MLERLSAAFHGKIFFVLIAIYALFGVFFILSGLLNYDEGFYLYESKLVYSGKLPYIDFLYTQPPLFLYVYGLPQFLFGNSLYVGRTTSLIFGILTCIFLFRLAKKIGGEPAANISLALLALNPYAIYYLTLAKTYALASFLLVLSMYFLVNENIKNPKRSALSVFFMCLAVGVRLSVAPALILLLIYIFYTQRKNFGVIKYSLLTAVLTCSIIFLPFFALDKDIAAFDLLEYRQTQLFGTTISQDIISKIALFPSLANKYFVIISLIALGAVSRFIRKDFFPNSMTTFMFFIVASIFLFNFLLTLTVAEYQTIIVPLAAAIAGYIFGGIYKNSQEGFIKFSFVVLIIFMIILTPLSQRGVRVDPNNLTPLQQVEDFADAVKGKAPDGGKLLAFNTILAVESGMDVLPGTEISMFSYFPSWENEKAKKYHVVNKEILDGYIESKAAAAILLTSFEIETLKIENSTLKLIEENYNLEKTAENWGPWGDTAYLYFPKS